MDDETSIHRIWMDRAVVGVGSRGEVGFEVEGCWKTAGTYVGSRAVRGGTILVYVNEEEVCCPVTA